MKSVMNRILSEFDDLLELPDPWLARRRWVEDAM